MTGTNGDRLLLLCGYLAVVAAALIVASMHVATPVTTTGSVLSGARFVVAVAAGIFGFIVWFDRRFPVDPALATIDVNDGDR